MSTIQFSDIVGITLSSVEVSPDKERIDLVATDGRKFLMWHRGDCCETVLVEDIAGDLADLIGTPILHAEESTNQDNPPPNADSFTWTFYKLRTVKGDVTIRWLGESNGYYSESVEFTEAA